MPARKAPSASDRPAREVRYASPRVMNNTFRTNNSFDLRLATTLNQYRISRGPARMSAPSTNAAFNSAPPTATPISSGGRPRAGMTIRRGTTARSWKSSTPMISRPWGVSSSSRSARSFDTIAVEDMAIAPPKTRLACHEAPDTMPSASPRDMVTSTCVRPRPNTTLRIAISFGRLNSSPIENIRKTMPNSAKCRVSLVSGISPKACGPRTTPVTRYPNMGGNCRLRNPTTASTAQASRTRTGCRETPAASIGGTYSSGYDLGCSVGYTSCL